MTFESTVTAEAFLLARIAFAGILGYLALGNLLDLSNTIAYARSKGAPAPRFMVPMMSVTLLAGAGSILVGAYPALGAIAIIAFLIGTTPVMHDFWAMEGQDRQNEQIHFLKNVGLLAGALVFFALSSTVWPYAADIGVL
ncbi:DoxX family protein [Halovenus sp. HT40]|uniref:DoxX family protein n=1 Tax=Halovenus sp. HT40 TaxID=3126691 RepID=UPI00300F5139